MKIGKVELWWRSGSWRHFDEWVFSYTNYCDCHLFEAGFWGFAYLSDNCKNKNLAA